MRDGISRFKLNPNRGQSSRHLFDVAEPYAHGRPAELDDISHLTDNHTLGDIVGFYLFGPAPVNARTLVCDLRVAKRAAHDARPGELIRCDGRGWANIRFGIKSQTEHFQQPANRPHKHRIELFHAHAAKARVALHALVRMDTGSIPDRINRDGAHRTDWDTITASNALLLIDQHEQPQSTTKRE